jgi:hypothetical protein
MRKFGTSMTRMCVLIGAALAVTLPATTLGAAELAGQRDAERKTTEWGAGA